jgi:hypothetical protein
LLKAGANPTLKNGHAQTPLDALRLGNSENHAAIAPLLKRSLAEGERTFHLWKCRQLIDVLHVVTKIADDAGETEDEKRGACLTEIPPYVAGRVNSNMSLPEVFLGKNSRPW